MDPQTVKARNREAFKLSRTVDGDVEDVDFERYAPDARRRGLPDDSSHTYTGRSVDVNEKNRAASASGTRTPKRPLRSTMR